MNEYFSDDLEMFSFSVMNASFCFAYVKFLAVAATSFVDNFKQLRTVQTLHGKKDLMGGVF